MKRPLLLSLILSLTVTLQIPAQSFEYNIHDGIYELKEMQNADVALSYFEQAQRMASYEREEDNAKVAQLLILKTQHFYKPYFEMVETGKTSIEENRFLDAYQAYHLARDLAHQNRQFKSEYSEDLDHQYLLRAESNVEYAELQLKTALRDERRKAVNAMQLNKYPQAILYLQKAKSLLRPSQNKEKKQLEESLKEATCGQRWLFGQTLYDMESYKLAIEAYESIADSCKQYFPVKTRLQEAKDKIQHLLISEAFIFYQKADHNAARGLFDQAKQYGETSYYKGQLDVIYQELLTQGDNLLGQKLYDHAIQQFTAARVYVKNDEINRRIKSCEDHKSYDHFYQRGYDFVKQEQIALAKDQFKKAAAALNTEEVKNLLDQCQIYLKQMDKGDRYIVRNKPEKALEAYTVAANAFSTREVEAKLAELR